MNCPRCNLPLVRDSYESYEMDLCQGCWGIWLDSGELEGILLSRQYQFSPEERESILEKHDTRDRPPLTPIKCPKCDLRMERLYLEPALFLIIDRCPHHGIWLDTGEIKAVQVLAEKSKEICRLLVQRIRGLPPRAG